MIQGRFSSYRVKVETAPINVLGCYDMAEYTPPQQIMDMTIHLDPRCHGPSFETGNSNQIVILTLEEYNEMLGHVVNKLIMTE